MTSSRVARASLWAFAGGTSQYLITFGLLLYLARVLDPRDFGLMATVSIGLELGMQIVRWGQVELLQQDRYQNDAMRNQAFRVSMILAIVFAALFLVVARPISQAYNATELATMFYLCAPVFLFTAIHATADGILRSEFRFRKLAYRGSIAAVIGGIVAVGVVALGFGALALAAQRLVQSGVSAIWVWSAVTWRPAFTRNIPVSVPFLRAGGHTMVGALLPALVPRSIDLCIAVLLGPTQLGLYKIAYRIFEFTAQLAIMPLVSVAGAQLARSAHNLASLRQSYMRFTQVGASVLCPAMIGFAIVAPEAIHFLFGPKWEAAVPLAQMISVLAITSPPNYFFPAAMIAIGQSRLLIRQGILQIIVGLGLAIVAAQYSLAAVLLTQIVRGVLLTAYNFWDMRRFAGLRFRQVVIGLAPPYVATAVMAVVLIALRLLLAASISPLALLVVLVMTGGVTYVATILIGVRLRYWPDFLAVIEQWIPARLLRLVKPLV